MRARRGLLLNRKLLVIPRRHALTCTQHPSDALPPSQVRMVDGSEYNVPVPEGVDPGGNFVAHFPVHDMQEVRTPSVRPPLPYMYPDLPGFFAHVLAHSQQTQAARGLLGADDEEGDVDLQRALQASTSEVAPSLNKVLRICTQRTRRNTEVERPRSKDRSYVYVLRFVEAAVFELFLTTGLPRVCSTPFIRTT